MRYNILYTCILCYFRVIFAFIHTRCEDLRIVSNEYFAENFLCCGSAVVNMYIQVKDKRAALSPLSLCYFIEPKIRCSYFGLGRNYNPLQYEKMLQQWLWQKCKSALQPEMESHISTSQAGCGVPVGNALSKIGCMIRAPLYIVCSYSEIPVD